jgi:glycerol-3-phosphate dehydrogenase (NAD(P)+)
MHSKYFRIYTCTDVVGVQLGGVLKNILAVASGICDGLGFGANMRAALVTRGLAEGLRLIESLGGKRQTLMGLSGAGDIFLSCSDNQSRNRRFGLLLSTGITIEQAKSQIGQSIEALNNIEHIHHLALNHNVSMPIVLAMRQIITNNLSLKQAIENLLERPAEVEWL